MPSFWKHPDWTVPVADSGGFAVRGVIEGFYGTYYTFPERNDLIRFIGKHGFNHYLYAPKNDRQHRARWWDPYPPRVLEEFAATIRVAERNHVTFSFAISFGVPIDFASPEDFGAVTAKYECLLERGCRSFAVLFDDSPTYFNHGQNAGHFRSPAHAHYDFANRLYAWLRSRIPAVSFFVCPVDYFGSPPFSRYLRELGHGLEDAIQLFYTGPAICSPTITIEDVVGFREATGRKPVIWDNYPANDLQMRPELHIGPLLGRDPRLAVGCAGYMANLMNQEEASKIPLLTTTEYLRDPGTYDPKAAWERALNLVGGADTYTHLRRFAENSLTSFLCTEPPVLDRLALDALHDLERGTPVVDSHAAARLSTYLDELDESMYYLRNRMENLALRQSMLPWIEALDDKLWLGRFALVALRTVQQDEDVRPARKRLHEQLADVRRNPKRIGGSSILGLAELAYAEAREAHKRPGGVASARPLHSVDDGTTGDDTPYLAEGA